MAWQPLAMWGFLFTCAGGYEAWSFRKKGKLTLSDGVWAVTREMAKHFPYALTMLGILIGTFIGHLFFCPCQLQ